MTLHNPLPIYESLANLARPAEETAGRRLLDLGKNDWLLRTIKARVAYHEVAGHILSTLTNRDEAVIVELVKNDIVPHQPPQLEPVSYDKVPADAIVRVAFWQLYEDIDDQFGTAYSAISLGAAHVGIFSVAYSLDRVAEITQSYRPPA